MRKLKRFVHKHKLLTILAAVLLALLLASTLTLIVHPELISIWKGEFTQKGWDNFPGLRYNIVEDMETKIDIWNLSKEEIISILEPDDKENVDSNSDDRSFLRYVIRTRSNILITSLIRYYCITFTDEGQVDNIVILYPS